MRPEQQIALIDGSKGKPLSALGYSTWVSRRHKYLYVAVQKVACTRIKLTLQEFEGFPVPESFKELHDRSNPSQQYVSRLIDLSKDECVAALNSTEWFKFGFVRNPYHRFFSAYKSKILVPDPDYPDQHLGLRDKIRQAYAYPIRSGKPAGSVAFRDFAHYAREAPEIKLDGHWKPQTEVLMSDLFEFDFIGRFESFQSDFSQVLKRLGASAEILERAKESVNSTAQIYHAAAYDRETADIVYESYRDDFENFGYDRDSWLFDYQV